MSNYSSSILILTRSIGFEKTIVNNSKKIALSDDVKVDTLRRFREYLSKFMMKRDTTIKSNIQNNESSYEMKMVENKDNYDVERLWSCCYCTFDNANEFASCGMCGIPRNVCFYCMCHICTA